MKTQDQLIALQNMARHAGPNIVIHQKTPANKRQTVPKFFAQIGQATISPVLPYAELNCFLMGYAKAAAPELLAALERLRDCPELNFDELEQETRDALVAAQAAILKAKGLA